MSDNYYDDEDDDEKYPIEGKDKKKDRIIWSKGPDWNEIFGSDMFKNIDVQEIKKMIEQFMDQFHLSNGKDPSKGPVVWGFSMSLGPDKKPIIRQFGNLDPRRKKNLIKAEREPLVDIIEEDAEITIIAEIPGVTKDDINLETTETTVELSVNTPKRKYYKEILLPSKVNRDSAKARYKNGILEVKLVKTRSKEEGTSIHVE